MDVSGHLRQWGFLLAAFACTFLLVDFFASNKMPGRKMPVNICQYVFASVLFCQYIFASGFFCQQNLLVYFASNFLPATYGQQFLPATFASGYFYSFLLNRRHVVIVDTLNLSELALKVLTSSQKALKLYIIF